LKQHIASIGEVERRNRGIEGWTSGLGLFQRSQVEAQAGFLPFSL